MKHTKHTLLESLQIGMGKFSANPFIQAISNGMIKILPITMVGSLCAILSNLGIPGYQSFIESNNLVSIIKTGSTMTTGIISIYVLAAIAHEMAKSLKSDAIASILIAIMVFFILTPLGKFEINESSISAFDIKYLGSKGMFVAMIVALTVTWFFDFLTRKNITIKLPDNVPPSVANSFSSLIPAMIIGMIAVIISGILTVTSFNNVHDFIYIILQEPLQHMGSSIWALMFLLFFSEILWFFGIHGSLATSAILYTLYQPLEMANLAAFSAGEELPNILTMTFINTLKGPRHFALAFLLLWLCRSKHLKSVGKIAIVPGFFGISEPMKFGIPMVLNPVLFIPMSLAPVISIAIAYVSTLLGLIPRVNGVTFPWNIPFFSGLVVGDWRTGVLQLVQVVVVMAIYYPFIKYIDKKNLESETLS